MTDERLCRCPACNPMHGVVGGRAMMSKARKQNLPPCAVCKDTRRVTVDVAKRWLDSYNGPPGKPWDVQTGVKRPPRPGLE